MNKFALLAAFTALSIPAIALAQSAPASVSTMPTAPSATPAPAAPIAARGKFRAACAADMTKFCGDVAAISSATPDQKKEQRGKMRACLTTHSADLSGDCKAAITARDLEHTAKKS